MKLTTEIGRVDHDQFLFDIEYFRETSKRPHLSMSLFGSLRH